MNPSLLFCFTGLLLITTIRLASQDNQQKPAEINILNAESMEAPYPGMDTDGIRLIDNVRLKHEDVHMFCDSAHRYSNTNIVHAFGNVHINQGDTLHMYSDNLVYYGNERYAEVRQNVRLEDNETSLMTEYLDFDLENNFGYYPKHGVVINGDNRLESQQGYYYTKEKLFFFKDSVVITNPDYIMMSDTLRYNTVTEVAYFLGPTKITGDEINIYCENGWFNTRTDISQFNENAQVKNNNQILLADSIFYDNGKGMGEAFINVEVTDTIENIIIKGNYAWFLRNPEEMFITERALLIQMSENDTLYMHADTLRSWLQISKTNIQRPYINDNELPDSIIMTPDSMNNILPDSAENQTPDSINKILPLPDSTDYQMQDSTSFYNQAEAVKPEENDTVRIMVAHYGARFFSHDMQGKCDSLYYNMRDSIVYMFGEPVVWSENSQLTSEFMEIHSKDGEPDHIVLKNSAFIVSEEDPELYNQIKGNDVIGYFRDGELFKVNVSGNAETLYYPMENEEIIGINKAASSRLIIFLNDGKPERIRFLKQPEAVLYPMSEISDEERLLKGFHWLDNIRPQNPEDVFRK